ncbi:MAG: hypothetical protein Q8L14_28145, partial [Myxococcales bacterium]|nr:hypothetical protein [Myxococcales bacterium]
AGGSAAGGSAAGGSAAGGSAAGGSAAGGSAAGGSAAGGSAAGGSAAGGSAAGGSAAGGSAAGGSAAGGSAAGGSAAGGSAAGGSAAGGSAAGGFAAGGSAAGGSAAGGSAVCPTNPTPRYFTIGSDTWNDLTPYGDDFILAGENGSISRFDPIDGGVTVLGGGTCAGRNYFGVSVRPIDQAVFLTTGTGSLIRWLGPGNCVGVNALTTGIGTSLRAYDDFIFVGSFDAPDIQTAGISIVSRVRADGGAPSSQTVTGAGQIWEISGPSPSVTFAAGWDHATQFRNRVWAYDLGAGSWMPVVSNNTNMTPLYAIDVPTPTLGFAAGDVFYEWNGSQWSPRSSPPLSVYGVKVFSSTEVYAVGTDTQSRAAVALWDGNTWTLIGPTVRPSGSIARVRGGSRCTLLGVGTGGNAMTTLP